MAYAIVMDVVQQLEFALKHLAATKTEMPADISPDDAWKQTLAILTSPMGRLESHAPPDLADRLRQFRAVRNALAHDVLLWWRIEAGVGLTSDRKVADWLITIEETAWDLHRHVSDLADQNMRALGIGDADTEIPAGSLRQMMLGDVTD